VHVRIVGAPVVSATDQERWKPEPIEVEPSRWDRWASRWPTRAEVIAGQAATPSTLLTAGVQDVDILQLVVHGLFDQDRARQAGFLMAADGAGSGSLWPEEIESARMPPLVLLAVCEAARAKLRRGDDGRGGMAAAFALGGADCVVLTPADLFLDAAIDLFERVHTRLAAGSSPSEALRDARAQIRVERGDVPLQDYLVHAWGAGDGHFVEPAPHARSPLAEEKNSSNRDRTWILFGAAGLALLIAILAAFRAGRRST
jgi:hypothetical protein